MHYPIIGWASIHSYIRAYIHASHLDYVQIALCVEHALRVGHHRVVQMSLGGNYIQENDYTVQQIRNICNNDGLVIIAAGNGVEDPENKNNVIGVDSSGAPAHGYVCMHGWVYIRKCVRARACMCVGVHVCKCMCMCCIFVCVWLGLLDGLRLCMSSLPSPFHPRAYDVYVHTCLSQCGPAAIMAHTIYPLTHAGMTKGPFGKAVLPTWPAELARTESCVISVANVQEDGNFHITR